MRYVTESQFPMETVISDDSDSDICSTAHCIEAGQYRSVDSVDEVLFVSARYIRNNIDERVDPCENFYEFTCGAFMRNTQLSPGGKLSDFLF